MDERDVLEYFGREIDLGPCLLGENLNLLTLRGFAPIDRLAVVSGPDIYDMERNPTGTQRNLDNPHARQAREYATNSGGVDAVDDPRAFPEIILNVRVRSSVDFYAVDGSDRAIGFDSFADPSVFHDVLIGVRVKLDRIEFPKESRSPHLSRVDGNHRLSGVDEVVESFLAEGGDEFDFPTVPFSLLVGLSDEQEAKLFRDVNGTTKKMETDHLLRIEIRQQGEGLREDPNKRALWIADELTKEGRAFHAKVFFGGDRSGVKEKYGRVPELRFNTLRRAIDTQLASSKKVAIFLRNKPDAQLDLVDAYWHAVRRTFADAWEDKKGHILLQTIGIGGFAIYGGTIIDEAYDEEKVSVDDFLDLLKPIAGVDLTREAYKGIAGAGGAKEVSVRLIESADPEAAKADRVARKLGHEATVSEKIAAALVESEPDDG
jgi:DGQHR domain-containing protein